MLSEGPDENLRSHLHEALATSFIYFNHEDFPLK
jgi:hypothetical protein